MSCAWYLSTHNMNACWSSDVERNSATSFTACANSFASVIRISCSTAVSHSLILRSFIGTGVENWTCIKAPYSVSLYWEPTHQRPAWEVQYVPPPTPKLKKVYHTCSPAYTPSRISSSLNPYSSSSVSSCTVNKHPVCTSPASALTPHNQLPFPHSSLVTCSQCHSQEGKTTRLLQLQLQFSDKQTTNSTVL